MKIPIPTPPFTPQPPLIERRPASVLSPHGARQDDYYWLRDDSRQDPDVLAVLRAENTYTDGYFEPLRSLVASLSQELKGRIPAQEASVPLWRHGRWWQNQYQAGLEYPLIISGADATESVGELIFDPNTARGNSTYYNLGALELSPDEHWLAVVEDRTGRREYVLRFLNRRTGDYAAESVMGIEPEIVWLPNQAILYIRKDPVTLLGLQVYRHRLGTDPELDECVYVETDSQFYLSLSRSRSGRFVTIELNQTLTSEVRWARWDDPELRWEVVLPRVHGVEYQAEDHGDDVVLLTNEVAPEFKLIHVPFKQRHTRAEWRTLLDHNADVLIDNFYNFSNGVVVRERAYGTTRLRWVDWQVSAVKLITHLPMPAVVDFGANADAQLDYVRWESSSLVQPRCIWDTSLATLETVQRFAAAVPNCDLTQYITQAISVISRDGQTIPVSVLRLKNKPAKARTQRQPVLVVGYGAYGLSYDPQFRSNWLSLVDRGMMVVIAHIRGGQELGRHWTEAGRREHKTNSFNDFEDVTRAIGQLVEVDANRVVAMGGSAGGLLMGAVANQAPQCYRAMVVQVPFVDVLTTMLDDELPLTTNEYDEWGNPTRSLAEYNRLLSYSPLDQVRRQSYPAMLVTTGLYDSQVQYWEPVKWVARLRSHKLDTNPLLLRTDMQAGHGGKAGRFERLDEIAYEYAFILNETGLA